MAQSMSMAEQEERELLEQQILSTLQDLDATLNMCRDAACDLLIDSRKFVGKVKSTHDSMKVWLSFFEAFNDIAIARKRFAEEQAAQAATANEQREVEEGKFLRQTPRTEEPKNIENVNQGGGNEEEHTQSTTSGIMTPPRAINQMQDDEIDSPVFSPPRFVEQTILFTPGKIGKSGGRGYNSPHRSGGGGLNALDDSISSENFTPTKLDFTFVAPTIYKFEESDEETPQEPEDSSVIEYPPDSPSQGQGQAQDEQVDEEESFAIEPPPASLTEQVEQRAPASSGPSGDALLANSSEESEEEDEPPSAQGFDITKFPQAFQHGQGAEQLRLVHSRLAYSKDRPKTLDELKEGLTLPPGRLELILDLMLARKFVRSEKRAEGTVYYLR